jgi:hypothetical protein
MEFCCRSPLDASVQLLTESNVSNFLPYILGNTGVFVAVMAGQITNYAVVNPKIVNDSQWSANMIL